MGTKKLLTQPIVMVIGGDVVPAQRPRIEGGQARYSESYEQWRKSALQALKVVIANMPAMVTQYFPLNGVQVAIEFHGCVRGNADLDNLEKGWQDVLVKAGVIGGDSVRKVNEINAKFFECDRPVSAIIIYPNWTPVSVVDPALLIASNIPKTVRLIKKKTAIGRSSKTTEQKK